jgi:hypothetical protein
MSGLPRILASGPVPVIDYLTKDYDGFRQGMLDRARVLLPEWKSRSEADFGVVLVELVAYAADILSYYQDRVANEAYLATATQRRSVLELLRLIGYQIDPGLSATALLHFEVTADVTVTGANLPYRVKTSGAPGVPDVSFEVTEPFRLIAANNGVPFVAGTPLVAGTAAGKVLHTQHALAAGDSVYLEEKLTTAGGPQIRRSPELAVVRVEDAGGGQDVITWNPAIEETFLTPDTLLKGNNLRASHGITVADEPVSVGDGTPGQSVRLLRKPMSFLLRDTQLRRRPSRPDLTVRVANVKWQEVDSFVASGPSDLHYITHVDDKDYLTVTFGSGQRGALVPPGAEIRSSYRIGLGVAGNVAKDALTTAVTAVPEVRSVTNPFAARGGSERESTEEAKISGPGLIIAQERAVTLEDYRNLALAFPGVGKARARVGLRGGYKVVQMFVAPEAPETTPPPPPSRELKVALKQHLESRQPVTRMAGVDVLDPRYVAIDIEAEVNVLASAQSGFVAQAVRAVVADLLSFARRDLGTPVRVGELYAALNRVDGVAFVLLKRVARSSALPPADAHACAPNDVPMAEDELAYLGTLSLTTLGGTL